MADVPPAIYPDHRGRVCLARIGGGSENVADRYLGRRLENGTIILEPAVVMTRRELKELLADPDKTVGM